MNLSGLRQSLRGQVLTPASPEYDVARRLWNAMIDRTQAASVRCAGPDDVTADNPTAARETLHPAIRAGGHNVAGLASVDEGLVIDVSRMKRIAVDPIARTATTEPGPTRGEFD